MTYKEQLKYIISVCTGATILARAGVLDGKRATTNKRSWTWATSTGPNVTWVSRLCPPAFSSSPPLLFQPQSKIHELNSIHRSQQPAGSNTATSSVPQVSRPVSTQHMPGSRVYMASQSRSILLSQLSMQGKRIRVMIRGQRFGMFRGLCDELLFKSTVGEGGHGRRARNRDSIWVYKRKSLVMVKGKREYNREIGIIRSMSHSENIWSPSHSASKNNDGGGGQEKEIRSSSHIIFPLISADCTNTPSPA